jgi:hypothetical protein
MSVCHGFTKLTLNDGNLHVFVDGRLDTQCTVYLAYILMKCECKG